MKLNYILLLTASLYFFGCANTRYTEYRGDGIIQGKGGSVRTVSGVEIWENGEPNRKYKIIGFAQDNRGEGPIANAVWDSAITKLVKQKSGDAVVFVSTTKVLSGIILDNGVIQHRNESKILIIKYLD